MDGITFSPQTTAYNYVNLSTDDIFAVEEYAINNGAPASTTWPTAGLGLYIPFYVSAPGNAIQIFWQNGAAVAGNVEAAIYDEYGNKLATSGVVVASGTAAPQAVTFAQPVPLYCGRYYIGIVASSASETVLAWGTSAAATNVNRLLGILEQTGVGTGLPATATFATSARSFLPICGVSFSSLAL